MKPVYTRPCLKKPKTEKERDTEREHNTREAVSEVNSAFFSVCVLSWILVALAWKWFLNRRKCWFVIFYPLSLESLALYNIMKSMLNVHVDCHTDLFLVYINILPNWSQPLSKGSACLIRILKAQCCGYIETPCWLSW